MIETVFFDRDQGAAELRGRESTMEAIRVAAFGRTLDRIGLPDPETTSGRPSGFLPRTTSSAC